VAARLRDLEGRLAVVGDESGPESGEMHLF